MNSFRLLIEEIRFRKAHFVQGLFAVTVASALFVAGPTLIEGYGRETQDHMRELEATATAELEQMRAETNAELKKLEDSTRKLMLEMGFNLMIVHKDTNMADFWADDFATATMPQDYVNRLAKARVLSLVTHLVATLQQKVEWNQRKVLLVGYLPETTQTHMGRKAPMGYNVTPGTVLLGHELAIGREPGQTIEVLGKSFTIARILPEQGSKDDITIAMHLSDAQTLLDKPDQVNQIMALGCRCAGERLPQVRAQLGKVLPDTKITEFRTIAVARAEQRDEVAAKRKKVLAVEREHQQGVLDEVAAQRANVLGTMQTLTGVTTPLVVLACAVWVGLLALANVRERRTEIGLWRALGIGSRKITILFLSKAMLLGLVGGGVGFLLGHWLAQWLGVSALDVASNHFTPAYSLLAATVVGAPFLCALASWLPTFAAVVQDPAVVLSRE